MLQIGQRRHGLVDDHVGAVGQRGEAPIGPQDLGRGAQLVRLGAGGDATRVHRQDLRGVEAAKHLHGPVGSPVEDGGPERRALVGLAGEDLRVADHDVLGVQRPERRRHGRVRQGDLPQLPARQGPLLHGLDQHLDVVSHVVTPPPLGILFSYSTPGSTV